MQNELIIKDEKIQDLVDTSITEKERKDTYPILVEYFIRAKYSISQELAIHRQRDTKEAEFNDYNRYCEECKLKAKEILGIE